ncbi:hypothetical protein PENSPDRAFT_573346, partial [Peniophora sp. CONT]
QEEVRGEGRGSYIWGRRSVHNIRIERLWVDVTSGFGSKWREFFRRLEVQHGLDVNNNAHIWLLQHIFLPAINRDADTWMRTWNMHTVARRGQSHLSPTQMYTRGIAQHGRRSVFAPYHPDDPATLDEQEQAAYGVDWNELDDARIRNHHQTNNAAVEGAEAGANPFTTHTPQNMPYVDVPDVGCPLNDEQMMTLDSYIDTLPSAYTVDAHMDSFAHVWDMALDYCTRMNAIHA